MSCCKDDHSDSYYNNMAPTPTNPNPPKFSFKTKSLVTTGNNHHLYGSQATQANYGSHSRYQVGANQMASTLKGSHTHEQLEILKIEEEITILRTQIEHVKKYEQNIIYPLEQEVIFYREQVRRRAQEIDQLSRMLQQAKRRSGSHFPVGQPPLGHR